MKLCFALLIPVLFLLQSCENNRNLTPAEKWEQYSKAKDINIGNLNFRFALPEGWSRIDTSFKGIKICLLLNDDTVFLPRINVTNESMHGKDHRNYVAGTRSFLKANNAGLKILNEGQLSIPGSTCYWYSYSRTMEGISRECVYYSIAINNISYNISAGVNPGGLAYYQPTFDKIVQSFRLNETLAHSSFSK